MRISTLLNSGAKRSVALATVLSLCFAASAQTFLDNGIIYKVNKGKVEVQPTKYTSGKNKGKPTECENGTAPDDYTGDIVVPAQVTYNGNTYPVSDIKSGFKASLITSIVIPDGVKVGRGALQDCANLTSATLPSDLALIDGNTFQNCTALTSITIPGSAKSVGGAAFQGCTALETIIVEDGAEPISFARDAFNAAPVVKTVKLNRQFDNTTKNTQDDRVFRGCKELVSVEIGGSFLDIPANFFENTTALKSVVFNSQVASIDYRAFANSGLEEITLPESLTSVSSSLFENCKSLRKVTLGAATKTISDMAFYNSTLQEINFPATLTSIGNLAFSGTQLSGKLELPEAVKSVGNQAFAMNAAVTEVVIPATVTNIGTGAFMGCTSVAKFTVAADNEAYAASEDGTYITSKDGKTLVAYAPAAAATEFKGDFTAVEAYAFYGAKNLTAIELPACTSWGDYALYGSGITKLTIGGTVGRYVAASCPALAELTVTCQEVPTGIAADCPELSKVTLADNVTIVRQDAFKNCAKVESLDLGKILVILETDCFAGSGIKNLTVRAFYPASMAEGVFKEGNDITVTVPADLVDAYKKATGWSFLNIVGDANLAVEGKQMGMPAGLYYAGDDNNLHCAYADGQFDDYEINMQHTFQLAEFGNRIYGASAGRKFWYSASSAVEGDGKLFYISKVDGNLFQAVVLDNAGNNAYKDPTGLYIYGSTLYVNDRNVCIRKISADALALPQDYPSWMENNWMSFYGGTWSYGCIKNGFAITQDADAAGNPEPRYWVGMKYNGCGLFSFKEGNIGTGSGDQAGSPAGAYEYMTNINLIATAFNIDTKNGHLYMYIETAGAQNQIKGGLYRISLDALDANKTPNANDFMTVLEAKLIDGAPVKYEGNATNEHVCVSQLAFDADGEYMYWCYRAPTPEEAADIEGKEFKGNGGTVGSGCAYPWAEAYDETNPLHHSGIKRIKLGVEDPVVEMVVPGVTGYGVVPVNYEGSTKPLGVQSPVVDSAVKAVAVADGFITALEDATVTVYAANGTIVAISNLAAGQTLSTADLAAGLYIVDARTAAGSQAVKFVK